MTPKERVKDFHEKFKVEEGYQHWISMISDHELLIELIEKYNIKSFFEVGTWEGYTALLVNQHPNIEKQKALDINKDMEVEYDKRFKNHHLREKEFYGSYFKDTDIELEFCDSTKYIPKYNEQYDMVYIDGNHTYDYVKKDTELAFKLNPKVIIWHDYHSGHPQIDKLINELKRKGNKIITTNIKPQHGGTIIAYLIIENE